ncbi:hypothetical protein B0H11DRAFT_2207989 [Mycena galericulata]|nr:hypothetical protein B0H11DRAFT_2207989 [Mycena galericulata]
MAYDPEKQRLPGAHLLPNPLKLPPAPISTVFLPPPCGRLLVTLTLGGATTAYALPDLARAAVPERLASYYHGSGWGSGNAPPPAHDSPERHPHPPGGAGAPGDAQDHVLLDADVPLPPPPSSSHDGEEEEDADTPQLIALRASPPCARGTRAPPKGYDEFFAFARERGCLDARAYGGIFADFAPFWGVERAASHPNGVDASGSKEGAGCFRTRVRTVAQWLAVTTDKRGMTALQIHGGKVARPDYQGTYFEGDWEATSAPALPDLTVLINGRDESCVVFDVKLLLAASYFSSYASSLSPAKSRDNEWGAGFVVFCVGFGLDTSSSAGESDRVGAGGDVSCTSPSFFPLPILLPPRPPHSHIKNRILRPHIEN